MTHAAPLAPALPQSVRIGPFDWKVENWPSQHACSANRLGECDFILTTIRIRTDMPAARIAETLVHESLHAVWYVSGCRFAAGDEEKIVSVMAMHWISVLRDNPWLPGWIAACVGVQA